MRKLLCKLRQASGPLALVFLFQAALAPPLAAWGPLGHQLAANAALEALPPELAPWFQGQAEVVARHSVDPDLWKARDPQEGPRHFLDCEAYGGPDRVPVSQAAARDQLGPERFQKNGQVPWVILDEVRILSDAFRADPHQVAFQAAILSHYVADLCVPLHSTSNHDGAATGQNGLHQRWETGLLRRVVDGEQWLPEVRPAVVGPDPWAEPMAWLRDSYALVRRVLADDLRAERARGQDGGGELDSRYWETFQARQGPVLKTQLTLAAQRTAEFIVWAWTRAGRPPCP